MAQAHDNDEQTPLLNRHHSGSDYQEEITFSSRDADDPKQWSRRRKVINVAVVSYMAILGSLASSIFAPGIDQMVDDLHTNRGVIIGATSTFVVSLGLGPLIFAPVSETIGRRQPYLWCLAFFAVLQIPAALTGDARLLLTVRGIAGFFGSVGVAIGGGTVSDMYEASERARVMGWYLLGPLLGPSIGPLIGGLIVQGLGWRWAFGVLGILAAINLVLVFFFADETYAPTILARRCKMLQEDDSSKRYTFAGNDDRPLRVKLWYTVARPVKILFTQPIVLSLASYQAIIFAAMYTLYTNMQQIFQQEPYGFDSLKVGLLCLFPTAGMIIAVATVVRHIDTIYNKLSQKHDGPKPEYRLPLAVIGSVSLPISIFAFGWLIEFRQHWLLCIIPVVLFGIGQVAIFNTAQNYFVDAFEKYAASAISAGVVFRSIVGGIVPLVSPALFDSLGLGWGWSAFGLLLVVVAPIPLVLLKVGPQLRKRFEIAL